MKTSFLFVTCVAVLSCGACSIERPSQIKASRVEVSEGIEQNTYDTAALDKRAIKNIVSAYHTQHGQALDLTVTYDPKSKKNTAMKATLEAARLAKELGDNGVKSISTKVLPVSDSWNVSHTLVSYKTLSASAPSDCGRMPGFDSAADVGNFDKHDNYDYGCTVGAMVVRQVADPSDLLGVEDQTETDSGRRAENVLSGRGYYGAEQFPRLEGEQASE